MSRENYVWFRVGIQCILIGRKRRKKGGRERLRKEGRKEGKVEITC